MFEKNNGNTECEKLQNRFTAFISTSMERARIDYLRKEYSRKKNTYEMDDEKLALVPDGTDFVSRICDREALSFALDQLSEKERYVIISKVIQEIGFEEIALELGMKFKGVEALYYRTIAKLRNILGGIQ